MIRGLSNCFEDLCNVAIEILCCIAGGVTCIELMSKEDREAKFDG